MNTYLKTEKNKSMSKFSLAFFNRKVKIYKMSHSIKSQNIMTETSIDDEITVYKYIAEDDLLFQTHAISCDTQSYNIINIYEDNPGINHIGIVHYISGIFCKNKIPLLYINTFSYNLILISDEYFENAKKVLLNDPNF